MQTLSVFKPSCPSFYKVYFDLTVMGSAEISESKESKITREWTDLSTMYVMLKYRKWQIKERKSTSLHVFHQKCTEDMNNELGINKTPTQIRDKVNNTRSSFHTILKQVKAGNFKWTQDKHASLTKTVYEFMLTHFDPSKEVPLEFVEQKLFSVTKAIKKQL
ncbi:hypothetical protein EIN_402740 [Entamoeba invadens IP1]|uniref:Myb/SANT-like domain-containing protein n=1 Tax=Entamoeba invadens IP1 TaxID=370355 RepID=A0A0A1U6N8_ENTIV|nr:hypothetical protein EIN_402740 [Entamoeba invadens IP1]ELP89980.1 hypothetical protein EIN_402740 [Entamoeba invadens IP1]|eukprot:XP_004256751.1 hypothetical protein EIN_402740 [Entamoeba invadens IP1]